MTSALASEIANDLPSAIDWRRSFKPGFREIYGRTDFLAEPYTYDDMGARIVARALSGLLEDECDRLNRLGLHDMARAAGVACHELCQIADCEDEDTREYRRDCEDALERGGSLIRDNNAGRRG